MRNLDMTTLRSFIAVADQEGVTRAASALNLTQSAVSMQLTRLEELLGINLMDRSSRRIALTPAGEQLLGFARRIVALNDDAVGRLTDQVWEGEISFGLPHDIIYPAIPKVLKQFHAAYPRVKVNLIASFTTSLLDSFGRGEIDLILTTEQLLGPGGETLTELPLRWYGAPGGTAWKQQPLRLASCRNCIFRGRAIRQLDAAGIPWESVIDSESDGAIQATVSADLAVTTILEGSAGHLEMVPLGGLPDLGTQRINMYGDAATMNPLVSALAATLRQGFAPLAAVPAVRTS